MLQSPSDLPAVLACRDTDLYKRFKGIDLTKGIDVAAEDADIKPVYNVSTEEINALAEELWASPRQTADRDTHETRLEAEWAFFAKHDRLGFLVTISRLISRFKRDNVVWGVGRGSSCASYLLYLMEVHDVNPITFAIDFSEFSKEK